MPNPRRLADLSGSEDPQNVGRLFRNARELAHEDLPKLRWRLRTSLHRRATRPSRVLRLALVAGLLLFVGGVVGAVVSPVWRKKESHAPASGPSVPVEHSIKRGPTSAAAPSPVPAEPLPEQVASGLDAVTGPAQERRPTAAPAKRAAQVRVAAAATLSPPPSPPAPPEDPPPEPAPATPSAIAAEQALLGRAIRTLRDDHDAGASLALIAHHAQEFPNGALSSEATMVRIEALLALGRQEEALSFLDRTSLTSLPNGDQQLVVRGELRAAKGRWQDAKQDFDQMLQQRNLPAASPRVRSLQERALWGRGSARSRLGDKNGARSDIELYLRLFPDGHFANEATSLLKVTP